MRAVDLYRRISLLKARSAAALLLWSSLAAPAQTVQVETGAICGIESNTTGVVAFKGIPFAAPPVGNLRWKPPVLPAHWTRALQADHFAPSCIQPVRDGSVPGGKSPNTNSSYDSWEFMTHGAVDEDCLYLNVWAPTNAGGNKMPLMVWIYGGPSMKAPPAIPAYDGERLAGHGAIVVSISYRLGAFGFLALPELDMESPHHVSGNYGLLDQIAALQSVKRNISALGGDPGRLTIFGQSDG